GDKPHPYEFELSRGNKTQQAVKSCKQFAKTDRLQPKIFS
ncbi:hypothetical protein AM305_00260, partial [Actinobacillus minor NM305]